MQNDRQAGINVNRQTANVKSETAANVKSETAGNVKRQMANVKSETAADVNRQTANVKSETAANVNRQTVTDGLRPKRDAGRKRVCALVLINFLIVSHSFAQTLFTYGKNAVTKQEFLNAYQKNNNQTSATHISYADYLDLYIKFRLKVQAAKDAGLDTLNEQKAELQSFHYQLAESFLKEDESINLLVDEAFARSLKDIHLSHIFIPLANSATKEDQDAARQKIQGVYDRLMNGESFENAAAGFQHGSMGYITVFVLPYNTESIAYAIPEGKYSKPFQSASGFHILRSDKIRPALGNIRVAQILLAFRPDATEEQKKLLAVRADSVYNALIAGADFGKLAEQVSDDHLSFQTAGEIPAFGVGQYDTVFENAAFALENDGDISKPFKTSFGYHILSRIQHIPVISDARNQEWKAMIKERVLQSDRMQAAQDMLISSIRKKIQNEASPSDLASDSAVLGYYRNHLEKYNSEFAEQMKEFREGNLLFGIMQEKVWDAATSDSAALRDYYEKNREKYFWENSADALIITCLDSTDVEKTQSAIKNKFSDWRQWTEAGDGMIQADSGRFELGQIPVAGRTDFTEGLITAPVINDQDNSRTFAYIIRLYQDRAQKQYEDAKGSVINDYQNFLEEKWITGLKKKYKVRINKRVLKSIENGD